MAGTATSFLNKLRSFIGIEENPDGSNRSKIGEMFGWNGVPWCAETQSLAAKSVGIDFWSASTDVWEARARTRYHGSRWISKTETPKPGDVAVWDWRGDGTANHVSAVESVRSDGKLVTIGGNESNRVQRAVRSKNGLRGYVRLPFGTVAVTKPPTISVAHPTLILGSVGPAVAEFQWKMNACAGGRLVGDSKYGTADKDQCIKFQRFFGLVDDGVCGPKTWGVLDYAYALYRAKR